MRWVVSRLSRVIIIAAVRRGRERAAWRVVGSDRRPLCGLGHFPAKWKPVRRRKCDQPKGNRSEFRFRRDGIRWMIRQFLGVGITALLVTVAALLPGRVRAETVDLLLALAADVSRSVDAQKFQLQREGYAAALTNPRVLEAISAGRHGRVAICYIEWSGAGDQKVVVDWMVIRDADSANRLPSLLTETPRAFADRTWISGGIDAAMAQMERAPFEARRRTIDASATAPIIPDAT